MRRRVRAIKRRGQPVCVKFVKDGDYYKLQCSSRPGFRHLSAPHEVAACIKRGDDYHITLAHGDWIRSLKRSKSRRACWAALKYLKEEFGVAQEVTLRVTKVYGSSVVVVDPTLPPFRHVYNNMKYLRKLVGNHDGNITISM